MGDTVNIRLTAEDKIHLQQRMDETGKKATENPHGVIIHVGIFRITIQ